MNFPVMAMNPVFLQLSTDLADRETSWSSLHEEVVMPACKFAPTPTFLPLFNIKQADLPVTCKLQAPPAGVTIALAQMFDSTGTPTTLTVSADGLSFVVPRTITVGSWDLEARVQGGTFPIPAIPVVEDCNASQWLFVITDPNSKAARVGVAVQS
jgi:hypothetical protein